MMRHAESEDNKNKLVSGNGRVPLLTEEGKKQAQERRGVLASIRPAIAYFVTSEMQRTQDTAKIICDCDVLRQIPQFVESGINERMYGQAEGMTDAERDKIKKAGGMIEGEENKEHQRVRTIRTIIHSLNHRDGIPLFITHGGNIRRVLEEAEAEEYMEEKIANCGLYEFNTPRGESGTWRVEKL